MLITKCTEQNRPLILAILSDGSLEDLVFGVLGDDWKLQEEHR